MNTSFFGQRSYGVVTAARYLFRQGSRRASVAEVALLAGIPNRPTDFNPIASTERATARRAYVLRRMNETGAITTPSYQAALAEPVPRRRTAPRRRSMRRTSREMVRVEMYAQASAPAPIPPASRSRRRSTVACRKPRTARCTTRCSHTTSGTAIAALAPGHVEVPKGTRRRLDRARSTTTRSSATEPAIVLGRRRERARVLRAQRRATIASGIVGRAVPQRRASTRRRRARSSSAATSCTSADGPGDGALAQIPEVEGAFVVGRSARRRGRRAHGRLRLLP